jgi:8-oxo-dGTP pyrophosphatase MutT (NUDIX family)
MNDRTRLEGTEKSAPLLSAGAVILAGAADRPLVALIHRRSPSEWRLPKGKLHEGETAQEAAEREVQEETGLQITVGEEVGNCEYGYRNGQGRGVRKRVRFFLARLPEPQALQPELRSFDQARWMPLGEALTSLTWENEREMVQTAVTRAA